MNRKTAVLSLAANLLLLAACHRDPLDYNTALALLKDKNMEPVKYAFSASIPRGNDVRLAEAYDRLVDAHVLTCTNNPAMGKICQPGPSGEALTQDGSSDLSFVAGRWVPASIVSINRGAGGDTATAEVRMAFEPTSLYRDFEGSFDQIEMLAGRPGIEGKREGKVVHASFQHADDGWHLESIE
jgi:hypothetical protein